MKKLFFLLVVALFLVSFSSFSTAEVIVNLSEGSINGMKVGSGLNRTKVTQAMGSGFTLDTFDDDMLGEVVHFYCFFTEGACVTGSKYYGQKEFLYDFQVYFNGYEDLDGNVYSDYAGRITPEVNKNDNPGSIQAKFGLPDKESSFEEARTLSYSMPYGNLEFWFLSGKLGRVTARIKR